MCNQNTKFRSWAAVIFLGRLISTSLLINHAPSFLHFLQIVSNCRFIDPKTSGNFSVEVSFLRKGKNVSFLKAYELRFLRHFKTHVGFPGACTDLLTGLDTNFAGSQSLLQLSDMQKQVSKSNWHHPIVNKSWIFNELFLIWNLRQLITHNENDLFH